MLLENISVGNLPCSKQRDAWRSPVFLLNKGIVYKALLVTALLFISGCEKRRQSFLTIQTCVVDKDGVDQLKNTMREIARSENLEFVDGSAETGADLKTIGADKALKRDAALTINVGIKDDSGIIVMGGNLGLPPYQVALGFGASSDAAKARRLSGRLVQALSQRWRVETVPQGRGVFPMKSCGG